MDLVNRLHFRTADTAVIAWSNVPCGGFCLIFCWWSAHRTVKGSALDALDELSPPGYGRAMRRVSEETAPISSKTPSPDLIGHLQETRGCARAMRAEAGRRRNNLLRSMKGGLYSSGRAIMCAEAEQHSAVLLSSHKGDNESARSLAWGGELAYMQGRFAMAVDILLSLANFRLPLELQTPPLTNSTVSHCHSSIYSQPEPS